MDELKPCPFCGGEKLSVFPPNCTEDSDYDRGDNAQPVVRCYTCFAEVMGKTWDHRMATAVAAWNRRSDPRDEVIARLVEAVENLLRNYLQDELDEPDLCVNDDHWTAIHDVDAALAAAKEHAPTEYARKVAQMKEDFPNGI